MGTERGLNETITYVTEVTFVDKPYRLVKKGTAIRSCLPCAARTDEILGRMEGTPASGEAAAVRHLKPGDEIKVVASAAIAVDAKLNPITDGKVVTDNAAAGNSICGIAVEAAGADEDVITMRVVSGQLWKD